MKVVYRLFCLHFARTCSPTYTVLSKAGTALVTSSICKMVVGLHSRGFSPGDPATKVQKQSNPLIPGLKSTNKVDKSRAMPAYVPGVTPPPSPGWPLISAWRHYQGHIMTCTVIINNALPWRQNVDFLLIYSFVSASVLSLTRVCK